MYAARVILASIVLALSACSMTNLKSRSSEVPATLALSGPWMLTVESPISTEDVQAVFFQAGEQLTGTMVSSMGEMPLQGRVQGNQVSFSMSLSVRGERLLLTYSGLVEGDHMTGTVQFGPIGNGKFSGVRKAETTAP